MDRQQDDATPARPRTLSPGGLARALGAWRRKPPPDTPRPVAAAGAGLSGVELDPEVHGLKGPGGSVRLSRTEWLLLACFLKSGGHVLSHETIIGQVWGESYLQAHHLLHDTVCRLRHRLQAAGLRHDPIDTVHGIGYRLIDGNQ